MSRWWRRLWKHYVFWNRSFKSPQYTIYNLSQDNWQSISNFLTLGDVVRIGSTCHQLHQISHKLSYKGNYSGNLYGLSLAMKSMYSNYVGQLGPKFVFDRQGIIINHKMAYLIVSAGFSLHHIPEQFKDPYLCQISVEYNPDNLGYVPRDLLTLNLCRSAVTRSPRMLQYVPLNLRNQI